jgi:hypothetical protein
VVQGAEGDSHMAILSRWVPRRLRVSPLSERPDWRVTGARPRRRRGGLRVGNRLLSAISVRILAPVLAHDSRDRHQDRRLRLAGEALLDLLGEPVALFGEPVELLGELADDPAGGLLGRDGDGLGRERGLDLVDQPGARPWRVALREWTEPAPPRGAQRGRRRIALQQRPAAGMVEPGPSTRSSAGLTASSMSRIRFAVRFTSWARSSS